MSSTSSIDALITDVPSQTVHIPPADKKFSGLTLIFLCAIGLLVSVLIFIFVKRQIMRIKSGSRRAPYTTIGQGAPKQLKTEIVRNLQAVADIRGNYQPRFCDQPNYSRRPASLKQRMAAMDELVLIDEDLTAARCGLIRRPSQPLYIFLNKLKATLPELNDSQIDDIAFLYEWARHSPEPFTQEQLDEFRRLVGTLRDMIRKNRDSLAAGGADDCPNGVQTPLLVSSKNTPSVFSRLFVKSDKETKL